MEATRSLTTPRTASTGVPALDATLGGHATEDVADTVRTFLKNLPANYPERLRNITLQSADELYRAAEIGKK